jgi:small subunit ribosomal protein S9
MKQSSINSVGKRKTAVARVFLKHGTGAITVNGKPYQEYFGRDTSNMVIMQPLKLLEVDEKFDIYVNVRGGGKAGQAGAVKHAISRALLTAVTESRPILKKHGYLTRDSRVVERKKYGKHKARKRPQFSKR